MTELHHFTSQLRTVFLGSMGVGPLKFISGFNGICNHCSQDSNALFVNSLSRREACTNLKFDLKVYRNECKNFDVSDWGQRSFGITRGQTVKISFIYNTCDRSHIWFVSDTLITKYSPKILIMYIYKAVYLFVLG